jgi:hypothetical protein
VPVYDLQIHDRDNDLIAGTHGRSIWTVNISPLQELSSIPPISAMHLFDIAPAYIHNVPRMEDIVGHKFFHTPRKPYGAVIHYHLRSPLPDSVEVVIRSPAGDVVRRMSAPAQAGLQRVVWDLGRDEPREREPDEPLRPSPGDSPGPGGVGRIPQAGNLREVLPGVYTVTARAGANSMTKAVEVKRLTPEEAGDNWHAVLPNPGWPAWATDRQGQ